MAVVLEFQDEHLADFLASVYPESIRKVDLPTVKPRHTEITVSVDEKAVHAYLDSWMQSQFDQSLKDLPPDA